MVCGDVLLELNALEVFTTAATAAPALFLSEPQLLSLISSLLAKGTQSGDATMLCFLLFRFIANLSQIGAGAVLGVEHSWVGRIFQTVLECPLGL